GATRLTIHLQRSGPIAISSLPPVDDVGGFRFTYKVDEMDCAIGRGDGVRLETCLRQSLDNHGRVGLRDGGSEHEEKSQQQGAGNGPAVLHKSHLDFDSSGHGQTTSVTS